MRSSFPVPGLNFGICLGFGILNLEFQPVRRLCQLSVVCGLRSAVLSSVSCYHHHLAGLEGERLNAVGHLEGLGRIKGRIVLFAQ